MAYKLIWSDEFSQDGQIDTNKWTFDLGDGSDRPNPIPAWGNNEKQIYTNSIDNVEVINNKLVIKPLFVNDVYTSARIKTEGKFSFKYGKVEARIKMPKSEGTCFALWMLPENEEYGVWPDSGEVDIVEYVRHEPNNIHQGVHSLRNTKIIKTQLTTDPTEEFKIYSIEWDERNISFFTDGVKTGEQSYFIEKDDYRYWPFNKEFHLLVNVSIGGNFERKTFINPDTFGETVEIDWIKVYEKEV
jgi:beta-glucanase (GH16 family)